MSTVPQNRNMLLYYSHTYLLFSLIARVCILYLPSQVKDFLPIILAYPFFPAFGDAALRLRASASA